MNQLEYSVKVCEEKAFNARTKYYLLEKESVYHIIDDLYFGKFPNERKKVIHETRDYTPRNRDISIVDAAQKIKDLIGSINGLMCANDLDTNDKLLFYAFPAKIREERVIMLEIQRSLANKNVETIFMHLNLGTDQKQGLLILTELK